MKKKTKWVAGLSLVVTLSLGVACGTYYMKQRSVDASTQESAVMAGKNISVPKAAKKRTAKITLKQKGTGISGTGASVTGKCVTIKEAGTYVVKGTLQDGQIVVDAGSKSTVILVLQGVKLTNSTEPVIKVKKAGHVSIQMKKNTENIFCQGTKVDVTKTEAAAEASGAAIYSKSDLSVAGKGSLTVYGYVNNGIQTKDNLLLAGGNITVEACNNGVKGKDSVTVTGGEFSITSAGDGIQSDNTDDGCGNVLISGGDFTIQSGNDAVQAENALVVSGGTFEITTGEGSANAPVQSDGGMGQFGGFGKNDGMRPGRGGWNSQSAGDTQNGDMTPPEMPDGENAQDLKKTNEMQNQQGNNTENSTEESDWDLSDESEESRKGLKSGKQLVVSGGDFVLDTYDDAIHSDGSIAVSGGGFTIKAGDDGMHAATELSVSGGVIDITKAYEGIEGNQITLDGAKITVVSTDDGVNAYGGQNNIGGSSKATEETPSLIILGGTILVNAEGDGLDSNGNLSIEGGTIVVDGPTNGGNGALDIGSENGGDCTISGGTVLALGSSGMAETFSADSKQCSFMHTLSSTYSEGSRIVIKDSDGEEMYTYTAKKNGNMVIFSSPELKEGETYILEVDGQKEEITMDSVSVSNGGGMGGMRDGGFGGGFKKFR